MTKPDVMVRVVIPHKDYGWDYHEWLTLGERVRVNRLMVSNPRVAYPTATKWICNGPGCPAFAFVSDTFIQRILKVLAPAGADPARPPVDPAQGVERVIAEALGIGERAHGGSSAAGELPPIAAPDPVPGRVGR